MNSRKRQRNPGQPSAEQYLIASRRCELMNLQHFLQMGKLIQSISNLVHGLQRERGASTIFLGSDGERFGLERQTMIAESACLYTVFERALAEIHEELTTHPVSSHLLAHIASALHGLSSLPALREEVKTRALPLSDATAAYSARIHRLITVVFEAADTAVDPSLARLLVAMVHLMNGKEFCGQERAAGSAGFAKGRFDIALTRRITHLVDAQERCFEVFLGFADAQSRGLLEDLRAHEREREIQRLRELGCSVGRYKGLAPELPDHWFKLMSERMDELKKVEESVEGRFHERCVERFAEARNSLAHHGTLIASLDQPENPARPQLILCEFASSEEPRPLEAWGSDGIGQRSGRSIFDLVQAQSRRLQQMNEDLQGAKEALEERKTQEKAVLLLMRHRKIDNDEAHRVLRKLAMDQGKKLPEVARALLSMADLLR
ncbi:MAG TPA: ANTAR domain-containing protein [Marinobacter sp.]|uniref:ANTAR domain-containing protein n=2 Tax=root TaxID=1 RepID=A0A831R4H5_9GAMM|nr:nitrate regulatory protein [Marinobacter antarcticus]HDZ38588.1 ANTAR domain-containing protein [Marinobacter sp.]HEA51861.1 ANTAR domain-containing protein [Marinobacter antarcticus]